MGTINVAQVQAHSWQHLAPCPRCAASNGATAEMCWRCEAPLEPSQPPPDESTVPLAAANEAAAPDPRQDPGAASFFPVLHDEIDAKEGAANDDASADPLAAFRLGRSKEKQSRTWLVAGACLGLCAALVVGYLLEPSPLPVAPDIREARMPYAVAVPAGFEVKPVQAAYKQRAPVAAMVSPPRPAAGADDIDTTPPPGCSAEVDALGLCGAVRPR